MVDTVNDSSLASDFEEESKFAGVVFHNIREVYFPGKDIRCYYSVKSYVSTTPNDWIGLFKVGWQSPRDYLCCEYSPVIEKPNESSSSLMTSSLSSQNSVVFRGSKLPSEESEFYQFCYVTSSGEIRGASFPFQIQLVKPSDLECCEEEDECGDTLLVIKNRTTMLEDSLAKAYHENAALKASKEKAEADCLAYQDMILNLETKKNDMASQLDKQKKIVEKVISEKTVVEESLLESVKKLESVEMALKETQEKVTLAERQCESEKLKCAQTNMDQQRFEEERVKLLSDRSTLEREIKALHANRDALVEQIAFGKDSLVKSKQANAALEKSMTELFNQLSLVEAESCKLKKELAATQLEMEDLSHSFGEKQSSMEKSHREEVASFEKELAVLTTQLTEKKERLAACEEDLKQLGVELEKQQADNQQLTEEYEDAISKIQEQLSQERAFNKSLSSASDQQVAELQELLSAQLEKNASAFQQIEEKTQENKQLVKDINSKEQIIEKMQHEKDELVVELESAKKRESENLQAAASSDGDSEKIKLEGPYFALQTAHSQLRKQYIQAKKDLENIWRQKGDLKRQLATFQSELPDSDLRFQLANLKKQIEDLRIRLNMGAEAYKAKFKECRKYENQLKKMQRGSPGPSSPPLSSSEADFEIRNLKESVENEKMATATMKKSMENHKKEVLEVKQELLKVTKENELLKRQVAELEDESRRTKLEKQKQVVEDKEVQSHIAGLHRRLEATTHALKKVEEEYKQVCFEKESDTAFWSEENRKLRNALEGMSAERNKLRRENEEQKEKIEELWQINKLVESVDKNDHPAESPVDVESCRGPPQSLPPSSLQTGLQCPMCQVYFPPNCPQENFADHVNHHFTD